MKKILIFTAGFGEGHNTAARGLLAAVRLIAPDDAEARVIDLFDECHGRLNRFARKAYIGLINRAPKIWEWIYQWLDAAEPGSKLNAFSKMRRRLAEILEREKPGAVVSVYPLYNYLIDRIYEKKTARAFLQITIVTDSITINSTWFRCGSDYFIVPNEETAAGLRGKVADEKIKAFGFPVAPCFATERARREPPAEGNRRVLYMVNSGKKQAPLLVRRLLELPGIQLAVTVGRDLALRAAVEKAVAASGRSADIYGWTDRLPDLLMSHHLLISKAGGATVQETLAARTPMLVTQVVPGQEEGNARLLLEHGCGALAGTPDAIVETVRAVFRNDAELWKKWEGNIAKLSRPDAALVIAKFILAAGRHG